MSITVEPISSIVEEGNGRTESRVTTSPVGDIEPTRKESFPVRITTRITLNLKRLETSTSDIIRAQEEAVSVQRNLGLVGIRSKKSISESRESMRIILATRNRIRAKSRELKKEEERIGNKDRKQKKRERIGKYYAVNVFLGRVVDTHPRTESQPIETERDPKRLRFRLSGFRPPIQKVDPLRELLISRQEAGKDVREAARFLNRNTRKRR